MLPRVEYYVTVPVPVDAAFQAFQDLERLLHRGIYDEVLWTEAAARVMSSFGRSGLLSPPS